MAGLLVAIVGDATSTRTLDPPLRDPAKARRAAEELGAELAKRGARLLVYGGPFIEADVVRGFVAGKPREDHSVVMCYSLDQAPPAFPEETSHPKLFRRRSERGADWQIAFYRSIASAEAVILIGGGESVKIVGQLAIGTRMPILSLPEFGGGAARVWGSLSAGEDLPSRDEINLMARPWGEGAAADCVSALYAQESRRRLAEGAPQPILSVLAGVLFSAALAIVPWVWGQNAFSVWMLFFAPYLAGGAGASIRPMVDRVRGTQGTASTVLAIVILGLVAGGVAGVLFVTAQLTADPTLTEGSKLFPYAQRSIPFAVGVGFIAGLTSDAVFGKLLGLDVVRPSGIGTPPTRT